MELAGEAGKALEAFFDTPLASLKIHLASGSPISPVRFFESDELALADMKERAEKPQLAKGSA